MKNGKRREESLVFRFTGMYVWDADMQLYCACAKEFPGANTQGRTLKEAKDNLLDAVRLLLGAYK